MKTIEEMKDILAFIINNFTNLQIFNTISSSAACLEWIIFWFYKIQTDLYKYNCNSLKATIT